MKRILALVILAVLISANAFAQAVNQAGNRITATMGDQDSNKNYRVSTDTTGLVQFANDTSIAYPYENITSPSSSTYTLSSTDSGSYITDWGHTAISHANVGGSGIGNKYVLPLCTTAILGMKFEVATALKETITVTPTSTADTIAYSISGTALSAGVGVKNSSTGAAGDKIGMVCSATGVWTITGCSGCATAP